MAPRWQRDPGPHRGGAAGDRRQAARGVRRRRGRHLPRRPGHRPCLRAGGAGVLYHARLRALPRVLPAWVGSEQPAVLVLGASSVEQEIFTEVIDEELAKAGRPERTYNLGMNSMTSELLPTVVRVVTAAYRRAGKRPAAIVLEMSPDPGSPGSRTVGWSWTTSLTGGRPTASLALVWQAPEEGAALARPPLRPGRVLGRLHHVPVHAVARHGRAAVLRRSDREPARGRRVAVAAHHDGREPRISPRPGARGRAQRFAELLPPRARRSSTRRWPRSASRSGRTP